MNTSALGSAFISQLEIKFILMSFSLDFDHFDF